MGGFYNELVITFEPAAYPHIQAFAVSIGIGLLIGLERERKSDAKAGLRTFALTALFGCLSALLSEKSGSGWILAAGLLMTATMMIVALASDPQEDGDPGTTSVVALMVCFGLGALVWYGQATLAVMLAITTTVLLYFKGQLQRRDAQPDAQGSDFDPAIRRAVDGGVADPAQPGLRPLPGAQPASGLVDGGTDLRPFAGGLRRPAHRRQPPRRAAAGLLRRTGLFHGHHAGVRAQCPGRSPT